jgi:excisionase family DNA binding protein
MADLLTTNEVQNLLHVDRTTIYRMVESGRLPAIRVGKQWRFPKPEIERWLRAQAAPPPAASAPSGTESAASGAQKGGGIPNLSGASLRDLLPAACAQSIQDAFADLLGVMIIVTDMTGQPVTLVSNPCGLYAAIIQDEDALAGCITHWQQMAEAVSLEPRFIPSEMGLLCARGLVRAGNELKGMVFFGGIAPDEWPPTETQIRAIAAHFNLAPDVIQDNVQAVYRLDRLSRDRVLGYVQRIADIFSHMLEDRNTLYARLQAIASLTAL